MEIKTFLNLFSVIIILLGILLTYKAYKGWNKSLVPRKSSAKILRNLLGYNGSRVFVGFMGVIFIILFSYHLILLNTGVRFPSSDKTDMIKVTCGDKVFYNEIKNIGNLKYGAGFFKKEEITALSLKNNHLKSIPDVVWDLNNLKVLNIENNKINEIKIDDILKLENLDTLIIINTPISDENLQEIENRMNIHIVK